MNLSMGPSFNITSASLSAFDTIAIIILVPIYDRILIPILRRWNLAPTYLQRVGIGLGVRLQNNRAPYTLAVSRCSKVDTSILRSCHECDAMLGSAALS